MTTAMTRLQEKLEQQKKTAANLKDRFREAMEIAVKDEGYCLDELQYFGVKAFREVLAHMRQQEEQKKVCDCCGRSANE